MVKIMLDAGHGGKDSGACGNGLMEKNLTLDIVKRIGALLSAYNVEVLYTRTDDTFIELSERAAMANRAKVDYFLSVHINETPSGTGFESYVQVGTDARTIALQNVIHQEVMKMIDVRDRGKQFKDLAVTRETRMPAILTENLFIDSRDAEKLKSNDYLQKIAQGHVNGLANAFDLTRKETPKRQFRIITGGFRETGISMISNFLFQNDFAGQIIFSNGGVDAYANIGVFGEGSPQTEAMENWLKTNGWYFERQYI
jgi:N-acetylmuramoyl-L-alanine amidase